MTTIPFLNDDEKNLFTVFMGRNKTGATLEDILTYTPSLAGIELRVERVDDEFVNVWANTKQIRAKDKARQRASDEKSLSEYIRDLPKMAGLFLFYSLVSGLGGALSVRFMALFVPFLKVVSFGTAFVYIFGLSAAISVFAILIGLLNKGHS